MNEQCFYIWGSVIVGGLVRLSDDSLTWILTIKKDKLTTKINIVYHDFDRDILIENRVFCRIVSFGENDKVKIFRRRSRVYYE